MARVKYNTKTGKRLKRGEKTTDAMGNTFTQGDRFDSSKVKYASSGGSSNSSAPGASAPKTTKFGKAPAQPPIPSAPAPTKSKMIGPQRPFIGPVKPNAPAPVFRQGAGANKPNASIKAIQEQLGITADGIFGPQTKSAIMAFQQRNGLVVDGIIGPQTTAALQSSGPDVKQGDSISGPGWSGKVEFNTLDGTKLKPGQATFSNPQAEIARINQEGNKGQQEDADFFVEDLGSDVAVKDSDKLINTLIESFEDKNKEEERKSRAEMLADKRAELGVDAKESALNALDSKLAALDDEFSSLQDEEDNSLRSMLQINRRKGQEQILYEKARNDILRERNTIANELTQKYNVLDSYMKYASMDYDDAEQAYNTKFSQAISMINLLKNVEESEKSDNEKKIDNAKGNLQLMFNMLKDKKIDYKNMDPKTLAEIQKLELQAGLPSGFTQFSLSAVDEPIVSIGGDFIDKNGNRMVPIYSKNPSTGMVTVKTISIGTGKVPQGDNSDEKEDIADALLDIKAQLSKGEAGALSYYIPFYEGEIRREYGAEALLKFQNEVEKLIKSRKSSNREI